MNTQPEALRLADALDELDSVFSQPGLCGEAAAELRRLHAENETLTGALFQAQEAAKFLLSQRDALLGACRMATMLRQLGGMLPGPRQIVEEVVKSADAAIAKAEGQQ